MTRIPFFFEVVESQSNAQYQICRRMMPLLFQRRIAPLPFAASADEARTVLAALRLRGTSPAIFLINTFWAEEMLPELDPMIGEAPVIFFKHNLYSANSSSLHKAIAGPPVDKATVLMQKMTPRLTSIWGFDAKTADTVAARTTEVLVQFLADGNFGHIERATPHESITQTFRKAVAEAQRGIGDFRLAFDNAPLAGRSSQTAAVGAPAQPVTGAIHGELSQMSLSTVLLMIEMEKKSGEIVVTRSVETGRVYVSNGRVLAAFVEGPLVPPQARSGAEAVYNLLTWKQGRFDFLPKAVNMEDKINQPTTALLMEGARRIDEPGK